MARGLEVAAAGEVTLGADPRERLLVGASASARRAVQDVDPGALGRQGHEGLAEEELGAGPVPLLGLLHGGVAPALEARPEVLLRLGRRGPLFEELSDLVAGVENPGRPSRGVAAHAWRELGGGRVGVLTFLGRCAGGLPGFRGKPRAVPVFTLILS